MGTAGHARKGRERADVGGDGAVDGDGKMKEIDLLVTVDERGSIFGTRVRTERPLVMVDWNGLPSAPGRAGTFLSRLRLQATDGML